MFGHTIDHGGGRSAVSPGDRASIFQSSRCWSPVTLHPLTNQFAHTAANTEMDSLHSRRWNSSNVAASREESRWKKETLVSRGCSKLSMKFYDGSCGSSIIRLREFLIILQGSYPTTIEVLGVAVVTKGRKKKKGVYFVPYAAEFKSRHAIFN